MGLRSKFLIILLVFSIVPLLALFLVNQRVFLDLGEDIYHIARVLLFQTTAKGLQASAENYAGNINREFDYINEGMKTCREGIERTLRASPVASTQEEVQWAQETINRVMPTCHQNMVAFRNDLVRLRVYLERGIKISYPENSKTDSMAESAEDGATFSIAIDLAEPRWILPDGRPFDANKGRVFTVTLPIHHPNGSILGTLAAEFDMLKFLEKIRPSSQWSLYMQSVLLRMDTIGETMSGLPVVIGARRLSPSKELEWKAEISPLRIDSRYSDKIKALFRGLHYGEEGYVSLPYEGEPSIWAFAEVDKGLGIVNILPEREILYRITRHPGRLSRWLTLDNLLAAATVVLFMVIVATHRSRRMLDPFFSLVSAFRRVSEGDFSTRLVFKAKDERQMVADAFNSMVLQLEDSIRVHQALEIAKEVQQNFFPETDPSIPGLDVAARIQYCEETGGDYIDVLGEEEGRIGIVVGDVSDHGIGAALLMATVRALIRGHYQTTSDLVQVMNAVNLNLTADMGNTGRFVTLFILEIDRRSSRRLKWIRAGHDPAWLFSAGDGSMTTLGGPGIALGVNSEFSYIENHRDQLDPGDIILIGTDGIWETTSPDGTLFGKRRLEKTVLENACKPAAEICDAVMAAVNRFRDDEKLKDDVSLVVVKNLV